MKQLKAMKDGYLLAVDIAWNDYQTKLTLEQWCASRGYAPKTCERLRQYLQAEGIL